MNRSGFQTAFPLHMLGDSEPSGLSLIRMLILLDQKLQMYDLILTLITKETSSPNPASLWLRCQYRNLV